MIRGIYKHYKGGMYRVTGTVVNAETERVFVLYTPCDPLHNGEQYVRSLYNFFELVRHNGKSVPRFELQP